MRFNVKMILLGLICMVIFTIFVLYSICGEHKNKVWQRNGKLTNKLIGETQLSEEIDCDINGEYVIGCRKEGDEVYLPFSFLHKYFEIYGKLANYDGLERFEWSHSYSKVYHPKAKYDPKGVYMYFENYNVEVRERVKCVSAIEGVPISTQWESQGYHYPTQIAQYGLSHYSKNLTEPEPRRKIIENADKEYSKWLIPKTGSIERIYDPSTYSRIVKFRTSEQFMDSIQLKMEHVLDFVMSVDILLYPNSSFTIELQNRETKYVYNLHYISTDVLITAQVRSNQIPIELN